MFTTRCPRCRRPKSPCAARSVRSNRAHSQACDPTKSKSTAPSPATRCGTTLGGASGDAASLAAPSRRLAKPIPQAGSHLCLGDRNQASATTLRGWRATVHCGLTRRAGTRVLSTMRSALFYNWLRLCGRWLVLQTLTRLGVKMPHLCRWQLRCGPSTRHSKTRQGLSRWSPRGHMRAPVVLRP